MKQKLLTAILALLSVLAVNAQESKPTMRIYDYQYRLLPMLAERTEIGDAGMYFLGTPLKANEILEQSGIVSPFKPAEIAVDTVSHKDGTIIVWTFPEPKEIPLALYVAFVPENEHYSVYTLEKTLNLGDEELWVIGGMTSEAHASYTHIPRPASPRDFTAELLKTLNKE